MTTDLAHLLNHELDTHAGVRQALFAGSIGEAWRWAGGSAHLVDYGIARKVRDPKRTI
jgi:hypothetical protein